MRTKSVLLALASLLALAPALLMQASGVAQENKEPDGGMGQPVVVPADRLEWTDLDPTGAPGVRIATLWGDYTKGAFGAVFRLPAGFSAPLHTHTHVMKLVIVSGTYVQAAEGKSAFRLGPGSYLLQPGGNYRHTTSCDPASDCVFFVESNGAFDLRPAASGKAPGQ